MSGPPRGPSFRAESRSLAGVSRSVFGIKAHIAWPFLVLAAVVLSAAVTFVSASAAHNLDQDQPGSGMQVRAHVPGLARDEPICLDVAGWSDARLAAQTIVLPVSESDLLSVRAAVEEGAGGIILFGSSAPPDLAAQAAELQGAAPDDAGIFIMSDEEGGGVQRMANLVGALPWPRDMAAMWTPAEITEHVRAVAENMAAVGVNMDLAPVLDVDGSDEAPGPANPDGWRSFGGGTSVVVRDGVAFVNGLRQGGVIAVVKHFPGLGGATGNTDDGPAQTLPWSTLQQVALPPFIAAIEAGTPAVMVSNAIVPGLTDRPAGLSSAVITEELRGTLGFNGLVVTDSLSAGAISAAGFDVPAAAVEALKAGADLVLFNAAGPSAAISQFHAIVAAETSAVASGALDRSRLVQAASKALTTRGVRVCAE